MKIVTQCLIPLNVITMSLGVSNAATLTASSPSGNYSYLVSPNVTIVAGNSFLQGSNFQFSNISGSSISAGISSFQGSDFSFADISYSSLAGGGSAFQGSIFLGANLSGSTFVGGISAFQRSVFDNSNMSYASIRGGASAFQGWSIDNVNFSGADLSLVPLSALQYGGPSRPSNPYSLGSPPLYDESTKFPSGMNTTSSSWVLVPEPSSLLLALSQGLFVLIRKRR